MATYHLHKWAVSFQEADYYLAPERVSKCLIGTRAEDGKSVQTSSIVKINGREITTKSGSVYILEDISEEYKQWLKDQGIFMNEAEPLYFKVITPPTLPSASMKQMKNSKKN